MKEFNVNKIIYSSSCTVYGDPQYLPLDENHPVGACTNPYGVSKYFVEKIITDSINIEVFLRVIGWQLCAFEIF